MVHIDYEAYAVEVEVPNFAAYMVVDSVFGIETQLVKEIVMVFDYVDDNQATIKKNANQVVRMVVKNNEQKLSDISFDPVINDEDIEEEDLLKVTAEN